MSTTATSQSFWCFLHCSKRCGVCAAGVSFPNAALPSAVKSSALYFINIPVSANSVKVWMSGDSRIGVRISGFGTKFILQSTLLQRVRHLGLALQACHQDRGI